MLKDFFSLSKKERQGFYILILLMTLLIVFPIVTNLYHRTQGKHLITLSSSDNDSILKRDSFILQPDTGVVRFNPNSVSLLQLQRMGLSKPASVNWIKYLDKGGVFRCPKDILKIYQMDTVFVNRYQSNMFFATESHRKFKKRTDNAFQEKVKYLDLNYATCSELKKLGMDQEVIDSIMLIRKTNWFKRKYRQDQLGRWNMEVMTDLFNRDLIPKFNQRKDLLVIDLNSADTSELMMLKGIGSVLSRRIVNYRKKLGGFYSVNQLYEVYGIPPETIEKCRISLRVDSTRIVPVRINEAGFFQLKEHPYLGFYRAKEIVEYRKSKGTIRTLKELFVLDSFQPADTGKIARYLSLN